MNRRRWFVGRKMAVWFWVFLALLITTDFCTNYIRLQRRAEPAAMADARGLLESGEISCPSFQGAVALTFDDGPSAACTPKLLDGLKERGVHASFFLVGQNIDGNEELVLRMYREGHLIGNHSQTHMQLTAESVEEACEQIEYTNQKIAAVTGTAPEYIRPPYGSWSEELECMVPMTVALWNLDPLDWKSQDKDAVVSYVKDHVENGSIILLHDIYDSSVEAALELVDCLSEEGYEFVTVEELLIE